MFRTHLQLHFFSRVLLVTWGHIFATRTVRCRTRLVRKLRKNPENSCAIPHREAGSNATPSVALKIHNYIF